MTEEVAVTVKGHITIPIQLRKKYKVGPGSRLEAIDTGERVLFKAKLTFFDLAGSGAKKATVKEVKEPLDKLRDT